MNSDPLSNSHSPSGASSGDDADIRDRIVGVHSAGWCHDEVTFSVWFDLDDGKIAASYYTLGQLPGIFQGPRVME